MDFNLDEFEDEEEENGWEGPVSGRNCIVFLVDFNEKMFQIDEETRIHPFKQSIECCKNALLHICRKETNDLTAIVLYGTNKKDGKYAKDNTVLLQPLGEPTIQKINELTQIIEDEGKEIENKYGHCDKYKLDDALLYCQSVINNSGPKVYSKNMVIFTNEDNPHGRTPELEFRARKQAEDYYRHEIDIEVVGLGNFDSSKFYKELILSSRGELLRDWEGRNPVKNIKEIDIEMQKLTDKFTRRLSFLNLGEVEGGKYQLQIALYKLYSEPKKFKKFKTTELSAETQNEEEIFADSEEIRRVCESEANKITNTIKNGFSSESTIVPVVGQKEIEISKSELNALMTKKPRGFEIIGFKKTEDIPLYYSVSEPYFIEPYGKDENNLKVFAHLMRRCLEKGVSILCWFSLTVASRPVVCALHPTEASSYAKNREHPPGFIVTRLPFSEMLLEPDEVEDNGQPSEEQMQAALEIVKKTTIPYSVDMFSDHERQSRIMMIESLAFEHEDVPEVDDDTDIDLEDINDRLGPLCAEFLNCSLIKEEISSAKRPGSSLNSGKPKLQKLDSPLLMVKNGLANKLTVAQLRDILKAEGIKSLSAMNKPTLVKIANERFGIS